MLSLEAVGIEGFVQLEAQSDKVDHDAGLIGPGLPISASRTGPIYGPTESARIR
jgi:hypothetical protein